MTTALPVTGAEIRDAAIAPLTDASYALRAMLEREPAYQQLHFALSQVESPLVRLRAAVLDRRGQR